MQAALCTAGLLDFDGHRFLNGSNDLMFSGLVGLGDGNVAHNINPDLCFLTKAKRPKL